MLPNTRPWPSKRHVTEYGDVWWTGVIPVHHVEARAPCGSLSRRSQARRKRRKLTGRALEGQRASWNLGDSPAPVPCLSAPDTDRCAERSAPVSRRRALSTKKVEDPDELCSVGFLKSLQRGPHPLMPHERSPATSQWTIKHWHQSYWERIGSRSSSPQPQPPHPLQSSKWERNGIELY